ncbi:ParB-like nuclease domain containing protein [Methanonatronarchaeum thermophilum]|uniref:ParB-like nuclease domain containing protein n=1 Tax=Methanonatronarchaeum thermophilum TaxID=1927129 RepID=A0A1Y3GDK3_9EURY|nr:hypothetical protein [Methanonatronarchaeum thermophilum]OUJ19307.1 ParB-like nuclease domain containing protein [Methanonatronarchaeum thermophilum]
MHDDRYGTKKKLEERVIELDKLYESIKKEGYKSQREIQQETRKNKKEIPAYINPIIPEREEIMVNIGRNGKFIFDDGYHRLSISKILNIKKIPVRVLVRHKKWQEKRKKLTKSFKKKEKTNEYTKHPDFRDIITR